MVPVNKNKNKRFSSLSKNRIRNKFCQSNKQLIHTKRQHQMLNYMFFKFLKMELEHNIMRMCSKVCNLIKKRMSFFNFFLEGKSLRNLKNEVPSILNCGMNMWNSKLFD